MKTDPAHQFLHKPSLKHQLAILTFIAFYFIRWFYGSMSSTEWFLNIGALVIFIACYFAAFNLAKWLLPSVAVMVLLSIAMAPLNPGANCFAIYASSFVVYTHKNKYAIGFSAALVLILLATTHFLNADFVSYFVVGSVIIFGLTSSGIIDKQRILNEQKQKKSQDEVTRLAKIAERERISQDLHDVVGHSLTAISLKAQLSFKLIEQGSSRAALEHIRDIQSTAQNSLKEIRETLSGMQKIGLDNELQAQQNFLHSAGVQLDYTCPGFSIPPKLESDLLLIVRECITNIIRHSKATQCDINMTKSDLGLDLRISDNGIGLKDLHQKGNGLGGIEKRTHYHQGSVHLTNSPGLTLDFHFPWNTEHDQATHDSR